MATPTAHPRTHVQLCGGFAVELEGRRIATPVGGRQPRLLFAYLVLHRVRPVRREELVAAIWPETPPASPDDALNTLLSRLRKWLGEGVICGRSELTLVLAADAVIDVEAAFEAIQRAESALEREDWRAAQDPAATALSVADRGFLPEAEAPWVEDERRRLGELRLRALECVAAAGLGLGGARLSQTERAARVLIADAPYRETGYRYLMQALSERGRVAEALTVFDGVRRLLREELGAAPGAGLRSLHERLLTHQGFAEQAERADPLAVGASTVTVLYTRLSAAGDGDGGRVHILRSAHGRLLRNAVAAHGGQGPDAVDEGFTAVFKSVRGALACAIQLHQAVALRNDRRADGPLLVATGLHCGAPSRPDDERSSQPVAVARRLCAAAEAGQILASATVRALAGSGQRFRELSSSAQPRAVEALWEQGTQQPLALPPILGVHERDVFVGRAPDLQRLWELYQHARAGSSHVVLLRGEPGIGKTRLASELGLRAHADGAIVLYGRCDEEPLLPHQPYVEALRHHVATCPLAELVGQVGPGSGELRRLVPELALRVAGLPEPLAGDPQGERYRLFEAVCALLCAMAELRPVVLVLDDLHWADKPSLLLLRHLVRHAREASLLVVGTYRDTELDPDHPLSATLADLSRESSTERCSLTMLDQAAVALLVQSHAGHAAPELSRLVFDETEGNPFFVVEMLRQLAESGAIEAGWDADRRTAAASVPEGVKEVIGRRLARLGQGTVGLLCVASVSGRDFGFAVLEHASDLDEDQLVEALDQAVRARVIEEVTDAVDRYTFSHALIRETLYGDLTATRRALLHRRVAASLEQLHAADLEPHRAELAHHFTQAGSAGDVEKAIEYGARAGDRAVAQLAYEQAAEHYRKAVSLIESVERPRLAQRCDLIIAQGDAERRAGDPAFRTTLLEASRLARELGDSERLARAALANNRGFFSATAGVDRERVATLEVALAAQPDGDSAVRASLLAHLAVELVADPDWPRRAAISDDALAMARRVGDQRTLVRTLNNRYTALWGPRTVQERLSNTREAVELAERIDDPGLTFDAAHFGAHAAMEAGDLALADRLLDRAGCLAEQLGQPIIHWYIAVGRAKRCAIAGSLTEAEQLSSAALELGRTAGQLDSFAWYANQLLALRFLQGTLGSGRPSFLKAAESGTPYDPSGEPVGSRSVPLLVEVVSIVTFCEVGRLDDARPRFDALMRDELADLPHDWAALAIPALASVACAHLGDAPRAERLYAMLEPFAGQFVDAGPSWLGATTHHLALLAATLGRRELAGAHFADAIERYGALGAGAWLPRARLDRARVLGAGRSDRS